jgi:pilus assembly protein CpaE
MRSPDDQAAPRRSRDGGVTAVEFAAILPFIGLILLLVWQIVLVGLTSMYASHGANEMARSVDVLGWPTGNTPQDVATRETIRKRTAARIFGDWGDVKHLRIRVEDGYAVVSIQTPAVFPAWRSPFWTTAKAKIVREAE